MLAMKNLLIKDLDKEMTGTLLPPELSKKLVWIFT